ncbi:hypothetical protein OCGS_1675 [Oceaniovalibus guishaninsula JLT2003]|uniref:OpgC protein n=1 Tax=Oceaniovalibus guishaninsula JLT2003 TaxID=1231392 RepID=K2HMW3_9RHOB|nr:hypothetical protein OCGS_1675 [Oceaniovalibus guishaninsula JLT2003]
MAGTPEAFWIAMTVIADSPDISGGRWPVPTASIEGAAAKGRDIRLDFFRGVAMFVILVAHVPRNPLAKWMPGRFGFSDSTEIFVFCSGMASAIAFGGIFARRGWVMGTARTIQRIWQIYWAHIGLFVATAALMAMLDATGAFGRSYIGNLNLVPFFKDPATQLPALMTLRYVPNYFDILPMYLGLLALMPLVVAARGLGVWAPVALVCGI